MNDRLLNISTPQRLTSEFIINPTPADLRQIAQRKDIKMIQVFIKQSEPENHPFTIQTLFDYDNKTTGIAEYSSIEKGSNYDLIVNYIDRHIITRNNTKVKITSTEPFKILKLMINNYPDEVDDKKIMNLSKMIHKDPNTIIKQISDLRKIIGENILPKNSRELSTDAKILIIRRNPDVI